MSSGVGSVLGQCPSEISWPSAVMPARIVWKWQQKNGSSDNKLPVT